ncbi:MAG: CbiX/SirB N-terminal domain-containing protein [Candidatus Nitrotoga sp.]
MKSAIILFAHGARDPEWAQPFHQIRDLVVKQFPATPVKIAFLELMQPSLIDTVTELHAQDIQHITLVPLFLARGGHLKQDIPRLMTNIRQLFPKVQIHTAPAIGEAPEILNGIALWIIAHHRQLVAQH